ncbi:MAG: chromosome segregation SMC family protein [Treponema sp.]
MFLKSLEIFGFKSFPDRVKVEFAEGITALLGPNGCGKSNVIDAIKWTLGESSSKALRAEKMEDVIFNGTESRRQMNVAEVCLTIDNEAGLLNFDSCEIAIKRRLYRSGESEYFINNQAVRQKDIKEMFWDTGVGKVAYSVMEQGKIDQILSSKPEERKYLFEEAAGITKFKIKRLEAERRLEKTEQNMKMLGASMSEVKKQYDTLKVQAEKASKYKEVKDALFEAEIDIQLLKLKSCVDDIALKKNDENTIKEEASSIQKEIQELDLNLNENLDEVTSMQEEFSTRQKELLKLDIERREKENQLQLYVKMDRELSEKLNLTMARLISCKERLSNTQEEIDEMKGSVISLTQKFNTIEENIKKMEEDINISVDNLNSNNEKVKKNRERIVLLEEEASSFSLSLKQITEDIVKELDEKLKSQGVSIEEKDKEAKLLTSLIEKLKESVKNNIDLFNSLDEFSPKEKIKEVLEKGAVSFSEIYKLADKMKEDFEAFKQHSALFIDDFLSPEGIITKKRNIDDQITKTREKIEETKVEIEKIENENSLLTLKIEESKKNLEALRIEKEKRLIEIQGLQGQIKLLEKQERSEAERLEELESEKTSHEAKQQQNTEEKLELEGEINSILHKGEGLAEELSDLQKVIESKNSYLSGNRKKLEEYNSKKMAVLSKLEKLQMDIVSLESYVRNIKDNFRETHSRQIMEFEERMYTIKENAGELREKANKLKSEISNMGHVNFMAIEEFKEVKERHEFLSAQIQDLEKAQKDLSRITEEIRAESTQLFVDTYNKIKKNFHNMFRRLFGGGRAEVRLTEPNNVLDSGIDIFAQPPGKRLENIGLLSGGEKSMTAVSLLFATYMVKPSPFCLLDEIDAALDEQNVMRFINTLKEFANVSQYIVITHNKKTVVGANAMLGVTMEESGVSKLIAIKLDTNFEAIKKESAIGDDEFVEEEVEKEDVIIPKRPAKRIKED